METLPDDHPFTNDNSPYHRVGAGPSAPRKSKRSFHVEFVGSVHPAIMEAFLISADILQAEAAQQINSITEKSD
jgi:hypothetical protein